jgi:hypothetical protein
VAARSSGFWACARSQRGAKITVGQKAMGHASLLPLARGLRRCGSPRTSLSRQRERGNQTSVRGVIR